VKPGMQTQLLILTLAVDIVVLLPAFQRVCASTWSSSCLPESNGRRDINTSTRGGEAGAEILHDSEG
jgi:hypothetical protein